MNKKTTFATLLTLLALLFQSVVAPQQASAAVCDAAQFVADVTVPDGKAYNAGDSFDKTWRLKNVGTCTWNGSYTLSFFSGEPMGTSTSGAFPNQSVAPGATIDLTIRLTAPNISGLLRGNWKLKNANGAIFGIGATADKPFWVEIRVNTGVGTGTLYNFADNITSATWTNGPGSKVDNPKLEDGSTFSGAGIQMIPPNVVDSYIQAEYPAMRIQSGDRFQSNVSCEFEATACFVRFRLDYKVGTDPTIRTFWVFREAYERLYFPANLDLSSLAGQDVKFILRVGAEGSAIGDRALWAGPRITRAGGTPASPTPTVTGTPPTPTNTPVPNSGADRATFVGETVPDGTTFGPNTAFTKTWRVKNTGTSTWTTAFKLVFVSGDQLGTITEVPLTSTITPNTTVDLPAVNMVSPSANGRYKGFWMLQNAAGARFGLGAKADKPWWVEIVVTGGSNFTATPTKTGTPPTPTATSPGPTKTPTPNTGPDKAAFVSDVKVPDGTTFGPNATFTKIWRIKNVGTSTWTTAYKLVFDSGDQMSGPVEKNLASSVAPQGTIDIPVDLISPGANGHYKGFWMLKNVAGARFGIGVTANRPFWVDILVSGAGTTATPTLTPTVTKTLVPGTATATPTITATSATSGWLTFTHQKYKFQFKYPPQGQISGQTDNVAHIAPLPIVAGTNLVEKYLDINVVENATACTSPLTSGHAPGSFTSVPVSINGIAFIKESGSDAGAGNVHKWTAYSTVKGNACISMSFVLHSLNPDNFTTPPVVFNEAAESAVFAEIMATFALIP